MVAKFDSPHLHVDTNCYSGSMNEESKTTNPDEWVVTEGWDDWWRVKQRASQSTPIRCVNEPMASHTAAALNAYEGRTR